MFIGTELWRDIISTELVQKTLPSGRVIETFPDLPETYYEALTRTAARIPDHAAVSDDLGRTFSFAELKTEVDRFAACLKHGYGVRRGSYVGLMTCSSCEYVVAFLALIKLGAVAVILPTKFKEQEIHSLIEKSDLQLLIYDSNYGSWFDRCGDEKLPMIRVELTEERFALAPYTDVCDSPVEPAESGSEDVAVMMFTSGTTSLSKGVLLTNYNFAHGAAVYRMIFGITDRDATVIPVPIYTITALSAVLGSFLQAGGTIYLQRKFRADRVLACIRDNGLTYMHAAPTVCGFLLEQKENFPELPTLRRIVCGGSRMPRQRIEQLHDWLPDCEYHNVYGMTETTSPGTIQPFNAIESREVDSNGLPVPGLIYKVVDEEGKELAPGETGEILVSGTCITIGYYNLDTPLYQNGWLDTGDVGYFTEDGYCYILDRKKDMINRGGEKLTSMDVEDQLLRIEGIDDAVVVGIPDDRYGEVPAALVKLAAGAVRTETEIQQVLRGRIAKYKIPARIVFTDDIPLTPNGKTDKKRIRQILANT